VGEADAPKVRPDPFWLVLQESGDIGELTLHPRGEDHELLLEVRRLKAQFAVEPIKLCLSVSDPAQYPRRGAVVLQRLAEIL